jgi:serine/threonine protein phosphatase 1
LSAADGERLIFAVGDVHGRLDLLMELAGACLRYANNQDRVEPVFVFLGDYVDRGPDSAGVIAFLRAFERDRQVVALRGNHERMMTDALLDGDDGLNWAANGLDSTAISYSYGSLVSLDMPADEKLTVLVEALRADPRVVDDARWMTNLPLVHEDQHRIYVHAGLRPGVSLAEQRAHDLTWIRGPFLRHHGSFGKLVVHGHTPTHDGKPEVHENRLNLDTGAYRTGILTAAVFNHREAGPTAFLQTGDRR